MKIKDFFNDRKCIICNSILIPMLKYKRNGKLELNYFIDNELNDLKAGTPLHIKEADDNIIQLVLDCRAQYDANKDITHRQLIFSNFIKLDEMVDIFIAAEYIKFEGVNIINHIINLNMIPFNRENQTAVYEDNIQFSPRYLNLIPFPNNIKTLKRLINKLHLLK